MTKSPWISAQISGPRYKALSKKEELELFKAVRIGDPRARARIVNANIKFVVAVASKHVNRGIPFEDLIAEGTVGLMKAVDRFDYVQGNKFISYAVWWIRQTILSSLGESSRAINLPPARIGVYFKISKARDRLYQELNREPSAAEVAEKAGLSESDVLESIRYCAPEISMNFEDEDGGENPLEGDTPPPDTGYQEILGWRYRAALMKELDPRDREIVESTYGLKDGIPRTLEEIGDRYGVTRELVRQRRGKALEQMRRKARLLESQANAEIAARRSMVKARGRMSIGEAS
jgi:RNA polymerase primary sigma factor